MYPEEDLNKGEDTAVVTSTVVTSTYTGEKTHNEPSEAKCCTCCSMMWVTIIGFLTFAFGCLLIGAALYGKFYYSDYEQINEALPSGGIWYILGVGVFVACCGLLLMLAICCNEDGAPKPFFKFVLVATSIVLLLMLILEVSAGATLVYALGIMGEETSASGSGLGAAIITQRNTYTDDAFTFCCNFPEPRTYDGTQIAHLTGDNATEVKACKWPTWNPAVRSRCETEPLSSDVKMTSEASSVYDCVCDGTPAEYGAYFGTMLQGSLLWIGVVSILFAICLLFGVIWTCYLGFLHCCQKDKNDGPKGEYAYNPNEQ